MPHDNRPAGDSRAKHDSRDVDDLCYEDPRADHTASTAENVAALNHEGDAAGAVDRRQAPRLDYNAHGTIETVAPDGASDVQVFTRDADSRGTGYVSLGPLPEGTRAVLHLPDPNDGGRTQRIECRVRRSREVGNGLFEGSVEFVGEQPQFSDTRIRITPFRAGR